MYEKQEKNGCSEIEPMGIHAVGDTVKVRIYAPNADAVCLCGDFNGWDLHSHPFSKCEKTDAWFITLPVDLFPIGTRYKIALTVLGETKLMRDPYAFCSEPEEGGASVYLTADAFPWSDGKWCEYRKRYGDEALSLPLNIYQMDLASWKRREDEGFLGYREIADQLSVYMRQMGYTHVELIRPFEYVSSGRTVSYFAPSSRFGTPEDFAYFVNALHCVGIGVILEWSPTRFAVTDGGLFSFDGTALYEYDERRGEDGTARFDLSKGAVREFLTAVAEYWFEAYHVDGLSTDTVYPTDPFGIYEPKGSGKIRDYAVFFSELNLKIKEKYPYALTVAEGGFPDLPLTATHKKGGLDFSLKRNFDWAKEFLEYAKTDPVFRKYYHGKLTYPMVYAYGDRFMLSLSKELFAGNASLLDSQFGEGADKFRGLRIFQMYAMAYPGKKLSFMGSEFGHRGEWDAENPLDWSQLDAEEHGKTRMFTAALNEFYLRNSVLWGDDFSWDGFRWILPNESEKNLIAFERRNAEGDRLICAVNFSGVDVSEYLLSLSEDVPYPDVDNGARPSDPEWEVVFSGDEFLNANTIRLNGGRLKISLPARSAIYLIPKRNEI